MSRNDAKPYLKDSAKDKAKRVWRDVSVIVRGRRLSCLASVGRGFAREREEGRGGVRRRFSAYE